MNQKINQNGISVIETMIVVAIIAVVITGAVLLFSHSTPFYHRAQVRQQLMLTSRSCMDTIMERLRNGKAQTLYISTPSITPLVPRSQVNFVLQSSLPSGATAYAIYLQNNIIYTQEFIPGGPNPPPSKVLAQNVTGLKFDSDPYLGIVNVTLRMDIPWDQTNDPSHTSTIILPNQSVHMVESH